MGFGECFCIMIGVVDEILWFYVMLCYDGWVLIGGLIFVYNFGLVLRSKVVGFVLDDWEYVNLLSFEGSIF